ncbi:MAG: hypothetical protein A4E63_01516 [Syntrophorhabdus sp. PtaU1.Bin050]|nr:MAG: hypothetical protein A4E63_01516 [Syntrophorhabdus sp. PtaU1.Bin050]
MGKEQQAIITEVEVVSDDDITHTLQVAIPMIDHVAQNMLEGRMVNEIKGIYTEDKAEDKCPEKSGFFL